MTIPANPYTIKVRQVILIGEAAARIRDALGPSVDVCRAKDMPGAVAAAQKKAKSGEIVLLSPMCSSFDMFRDYKARGEAFKEAVNALRMLPEESKK